MDSDLTKRQEAFLRRMAMSQGYRLRKDRESWSLVIAATGKSSSLGRMSLDQAAETLFSMG